jgi:ATP-dependent Clp protease ATP-binding subunit ClpA
MGCIIGRHSGNTINLNSSKAVMKLTIEKPEAILFIDEIHNTLIGARLRCGGGALDSFEFIKEPALSGSFAA